MTHHTHSTTPSGPDQPGPYVPQSGPYGNLNPYGGGQASGPVPSGPLPPGPVPSAPAAPARRRFTGRPAALLAAGVAALLAVGGAWFALSGDDGGGAGNDKPVAGADAGPSGAASGGRKEKGKEEAAGASAPDSAEAARLNAGRKPGDAKVLWYRANDVDLPSLGADVLGPWIVGDTVVTAMYRTVTAHSAVDGTLKWSLPLGTGICRAPQNASPDGKIVLAVQERPGKKDDECRSLRMIDLRTGKQVWQRKIAKEGGFDWFDDYSIVISGNTVTAGRNDHSTAYRLSDGKQVFGRWKDSSCQPYAYAAGGPRLVAAVSCPSKDADKPQEEIHEVDPATGASRWKYRLPRGYRVDHVYSVRPLVVSATDRARERHGVVVLNDDGTKRSSLKGQGDYAAGCSDGLADEGNLQNCQVVVDGSTLYMATAPPPSLKKGNTIVAFDLRTGAELRRIPAPGSHTMMPLRMEGKNLIVHIRATVDEKASGAVASVAPGATRPRVLLRFPLPTADAEWRFNGPRTLYENGRFILVNHTVVGMDDEKEKERPMMMAIGE
ncbi:PQQ-binding-like beta-propeller repeat protein [Streptomyces sp. NPDC057445]|uniref:outer membrane protein assembly factor BamB family protein n=1 Tax=Streptomyces sp. NPDC057445 TaxID=3346136 RepID=UPI00367B4FA4